MNTNTSKGNKFNRPRLSVAAAAMSLLTASAVSFAADSSSLPGRSLASNPQPPAAEYLKDVNATYQILVSYQDAKTLKTSIVYCEDGRLKDKLVVHSDPNYNYIASMERVYKNSKGESVMSGSIQLETRDSGTAELRLRGFFWPSKIGMGFPIANTSLVDKTKLSSPMIQSSGTANEDGTIVSTFEEERKSQYNIEISINRPIDCAHDLRNQK